MEIKNTIFTVLILAAMMVIISNALSTPVKPTSATAMAIIASNQDGISTTYCSAQDECYGETLIGFQKADCSWTNVRSCGANSTCPRGQALVQACNRTCSNSQCQPCSPKCAVPTPIPTPREVVLIEKCGLTLPGICMGNESYQKNLDEEIESTKIACKKRFDAGQQLFSCPACPENSVLYKCEQSFFGLLWKSTCIQQNTNAECGKAVICPEGFDQVREPCTKTTQQKMQCCKVESR